MPVFQKVGYSENFVQCTIDGGLGEKKKGATLVVGGDGRFYNDHVVQLIIRIAAANGVRKIKKQLQRTKRKTKVLHNCF